jgi:hypothetical protein
MIYGIYCQHFPHYNVLLYTAVAPVAWVAAAPCLCRELLEERQNTSILFTFQKTYEENFPKIAKMTMKETSKPKNSLRNFSQAEKRPKT